MTSTKTAFVVLAAGKGTRMKSKWPKVMHPLAGRPLVGHVVATLESLAPARIVVVVGPEMDDVARAVAPHPTRVQAERLGTGHAVRMAEPALADFAGDVLIVYGDTPLLSARTLEAMLAARHAEPRPDLVVLGFEPAEPGGYGRLIRDAAGDLAGIVEEKDATPEQRAIRLCNAGVMVADRAVLFGLLARVGNDNAQAEYYLTDIVGLARADGLKCRAVTGREDELIGINSRADLARAESFVQAGLRERAMAAGVTLIAPETVHLSADTGFAADVVVHPYVVFGPKVRVEADVEILPFCHFEDAVIGAGARVGPYARLRPGTEVGAGAHVGNFVEMKNATLEPGAKANHLTYLGDAHVGAKANVGAGTITCNYDGFFKEKTIIGAGAFIGSNTCLVAPVTVGPGAIVGAGSVIAKDVPGDALALTRGDHVAKEGWAAAFRDQQRARKEAAKKKD